MKKRVFYVLLSILIISIPLIIYSSKQKLFDYHKGQEPSEEDKVKIEEYYTKCPFVKLTMADKVGTKSNYFEITDLHCNEIDSQEDVTVEIYTSDFEQGKQVLRNWLAENCLQESDRLRIEYIHAPK